MSKDQKDCIGIIILILIGVIFCLPGCAISIGRHYALENQEHSKIFCSPCIGVGEKGKGAGFIWYRE